MTESVRLLATKLRGAAGQARYLPRTLRLVWAASRGLTLLWIGLLVAQGLLPVAVVYLTRELVDGLVGAVGAAGDWPRVSATLVTGAVMGGILLLGELLHSASDWVRNVQAKRVEDHINALVHRKSTTVDLAFYESPDYHDHLHRARAEASFRPVALLENAGALIQNGITLVAMAAVLVPYGLWIPLALFVSTLPAFVVVVRFALRQHRWNLRTTADERRAAYYDWLMTTGETAAELRLFGLGNRFQEAYQDLRTRLRREELQIARAHGVAELAASAIALVITAGCLVWMALRAMSGEATLGDLALFYQAFSQGQRLMRSLLASVGQAYYNVLFLGNLFAFLDLQAQVMDPPQPRRAPAAEERPLGFDVRFRDVTFRYPGSDRAALHRLDLAIPAGQIAAVVGANGAGKSTLIRLLCRFYDPQEGRIELDGIDVRDLALRELRGLITVLFQDPVHYNASVAENIALDPHSAKSHAGLEAAARAAGADAMIERLPSGYETLLGKWFAGGVELSTGEWQRLALARAFMRPSRVILLDEPTSAMDSWAESDWIRRFRSLAAGRTAIIVTHRFTTAMQADVIYVMDEGGIREYGSHAELLGQGGAYAQSWRAQMRAEHGAPVR
jgi:ATP-binding cassette, subfamily B, bacterial